ncbi:hypothetical protein EWB00_009291 [Schistosoma japonicum]|uniref:Uncharacterized protein n=1 Tax=Schistosoma japonicum TaxID=6182 RepID=A0A4Z2CMW0_SCHJA|nr:hypothetical protein EWB00_009291 [Schistosoma japonicum]
MNTFINPRSTLNKQFIYATHNANSTNSQNQSPISNDKQQPRWRKPLFSNTDLGHHNHLFDEFPLTKISPGKYTSTLPSNNKANLMNHVKLTDNFNQNHSINPHVDMTN